MAGTDDLAPLFTGRRFEGRVAAGQATITAYDPSDNTHTLNFRGAKIENVGVLHGVSSMGYQPGQVVLLLGLIPDRGTSTWWILGRALIPGQDSPDLTVRGASIIVDGGDIQVVSGDITVEDGGAFIALDGSTIVARYDDGSDAVKWGSLHNQLTGDPSGHGLLVQDNDAGGNEDIFRAKRELNGDLVVVAGSSEQNVDFFQAATDSMTLASDQVTPIAIGLDTTDVIIATDSTTGSSANVHLSGTIQGIVSRVTSARRFKQDIADLQVNPRTILDLKPRMWRDVGEVKRQPDTDRWHVGYIAEELDEIGLGAFVDYDEHGNPDSIEYDRLIVPLVEQVKALTVWAESQGFRQQPTAITDVPKRVRDADGDKLRLSGPSKAR